MKEFLKLVETLTKQGLQPESYPAPDELLFELRDGLSHQLVAWYKVASPLGFSLEIRKSVEYAYIWDCAYLVEGQGGYAFDVGSYETNEAWNPTWLVFGGSDHEPLVTVIGNTDDKRIYCGDQLHLSMPMVQDETNHLFKLHPWTLKPISDDLPTFFAGLDAYCKLRFEFFGQEVANRNEIPVFREEMEKRLTNSGIAKDYVGNWFYWLWY